jgi:hypothetical protein
MLLLARCDLETEAAELPAQLYPPSLVTTPYPSSPHASLDGGSDHRNALSVFSGLFLAPHLT